MRQNRPEVTEVSLARMLRAHVVENRALMERIGKPQAILTISERAGTPGRTEELAARLERALPPDVTASRKESTGNNAALFLSFDGFEDEHGLAMAIVSPATDTEGRTWAIIGGGYAIPYQQDEDDEKWAAELARMANNLNDKVPAGAWVVSEGLLMLVNVGGYPAEEWDEEKMQAAAESVMTAVAYGSFAARRLAEDESDHPAYTREMENAQLNRAAGNRYTGAEMREALERYRSSLPELLGAVTELRHQPQMRGQNGTSSILRLPFPGEGGENSITVQFWQSEDDDATTHPSGVKVHAYLPGRFLQATANEWCGILNGGDESDETAVTTSWQEGNWYHIPVSDRADAEHRIAYYATLPNKLRGRIDLAAEIDATVREIWSSCDRVMFSRRHTWMMTPEDRTEEAGT